jgi:hypothetical protein
MSACVACLKFSCGYVMQVKAAGVAGLVSYALWEFVFWTVSVPLGQYPLFITSTDSTFRHTGSPCILHFVLSAIRAPV